MSEQTINMNGVRQWTIRFDRPEVGNPTVTITDAGGRERFRGKYEIVGAHFACALHEIDQLRAEVERLNAEGGKTAAMPSGDWVMVRREWLAKRAEEWAAKAREPWHVGQEYELGLADGLDEARRHARPVPPSVDDVVEAVRAENIPPMGLAWTVCLDAVLAKAREMGE